MAVTKIKPIKSTLSKALDYIENPDKTDGKMLVSSFGCSHRHKVCPCLYLMWEKRLGSSHIETVKGDRP